MFSWKQSKAMEVKKQTNSKHLKTHCISLSHIYYCLNDSRLLRKEEYDLALLISISLYLCWDAHMILYLSTRICLAFFFFFWLNIWRQVTARLRKKLLYDKIWRIDQTVPETLHQEMQSLKDMFFQILAIKKLKKALENITWLAPQ